MTETTRSGGILGLLVGGLLLLAPTPARAGDEPFVTYEDWMGSPTIRSDRWSAVSDLGHERLREIKDGKFLMRYRREGGTDSDSGSTGNVNNRLILTHPVLVDKLEADFKVRQLTVTGCTANATPSTARAVAIDLNRFSDLDPATPRPPGSLIGDYLARVQALRTSDSTDPAHMLAVQAILFRCDNAACSLATRVVGPIALGGVRLNHRFRLRLVWDASGSQFLAGLNDGPEVPLAYLAAANSRPANSPFAILRTQHTAANCTVASGGPTVTDAEVEVGEVRTNASAVVP